MDTERRAKLNAYAKEYYRRNKDECKKFQRNYYLKNKDACKEKARVYAAKNRHRTRARARLRHLLSAYGLTPEQFKELAANQGGKCPLCDRQLQLSADGLNSHQAPVDHCHKSERVRGILCVNCNLGLGLVEREGWLDRALAYKKKFEG
jgi:hypothetical protein